LGRLSPEAAALIVVCVADLATTMVALAMGLACEGNPLMAPLARAGLPTLVGAKIALVAGPLAVLEWARRHRPRFTAIAMRVCVGLYLAAYGAGAWRLNTDASPVCSFESAFSTAGSAAWPREAPDLPVGAIVRPEVTP